MLPAPLTPVDCVSPAMAHTKRLLFQPFRMRFWLKLAIVAVMSGALVGGCNANFNFNNGFGNARRSGGDTTTTTGSQMPPEFAKLAASLRANPGMWAAIATIVIAVLVAVFILFLYIASVLRFVWLEALLSGECRIRAGWQFWKIEGMRLFGWQLLFGMVSTGGMFALIALPLYAAWHKGILGDIPRHLPEFFAGMALIFLTVMALALVSFVIGTFMHDFVIPVMRYERAGFISAWRTAWMWLGNTPGSLAIYYLLKLALLMGAGIVASILALIVFMVLLLPMILFGIVAVLLGVMIATLGPAGLAIVIMLGFICVLVFGLAMAYAQATLTLPLAAFMQYYSLYYLGSRYQPLGEQLLPTPPPLPVAPPVAPPIVPVDPGSGLAPA